MIKLHFHLLLDVVYMTSRKNALKVFFYRSSGEYRGSCSKMLIKIGVLENFANFTRKRLFWSVLLIKLQASGLQLYLKETPKHRYFPVKPAKFLRTLILKEHLRWLSLRIMMHQGIRNCSQLTYEF